MRTTRQQVGQHRLLCLTVSGRGHDHKLGSAQLQGHLQAGAAGEGDLPVGARRHQGQHLGSLAGRHRSEQRHALGTHGQSQRDVLHQRTGQDVATGRPHGGAHAEP